VLVVCNYVHSIGIQGIKKALNRSSTALTELKQKYTDYTRNARPKSTGVKAILRYAAQNTGSADSSNVINWSLVTSYTNLVEFILRTLTTPHEYQREFHYACLIGIIPAMFGEGWRNYIPIISSIIEIPDGTIQSVIYFYAMRRFGKSLGSAQFMAGCMLHIESFRALYCSASVDSAEDWVRDVNAELTRHVGENNPALRTSSKKISYTPPGGKIASIRIVAATPEVSFSFFFLSL
jgi:hypothetical protein